MSPRLRLAAAALVFFGWIGWLVYLAATTTQPVVLSRPQFLVSNLCVVAHLSGGTDRPENLVKVEEIVWPSEQTALQADPKLVVLNLPRLGARQGWAGPGEYILPLTRGPNGAYWVTPTPPSPGFPSGAGPATDQAELLRIYPNSYEVRRQLEEIEQLRQ